MEKQQLYLLLNRLLANYFVLYVKLNRYSWYGLDNDDLLLQDFYKDYQLTIKEDIDSLAEGILTIGGKPFATMIKFLKESTLVEATADDEEEEKVQQLINDITELTILIDKELYLAAKKLNDKITLTLLGELAKKLDENKAVLITFNH